jgi:hypothetical protein
LTIVSQNIALFVRHNIVYICSIKHRCGFQDEMVRPEEFNGKNLGDSGDGRDRDNGDDSISSRESGLDNGGAVNAIGASDVRAESGGGNGGGGGLKASLLPWFFWFYPTAIWGYLWSLPTTYPMPWPLNWAYKLAF